VIVTFDYSNLLYARATRAIVNYAPISEYILHECKKYNNYWNPRKNTLAYFILFLEFNSNAFSFGKSIT